MPAAAGREVEHGAAGRHEPGEALDPGRGQMAERVRLVAGRGGAA